MRSIFDRLTRRSRLAIEPMVESNSIDLLKRLARLSDLATVLTRADVELERLGGTLTFVPIISDEVRWQTLVIVHRFSAQLSGFTMRFAEKLADVVQQIGDGESALWCHGQFGRTTLESDFHWLYRLASG